MFAADITRLRKLGFQGLLFQALNFLTVVSSGLMMWKGLCLVTNSESPIVVVLSGSMEPAFYRGDILFLWNPPNVPYEVGDITVYKIPGGDIPIVHRVIESHLSNTTQLLLTKGDNNDGDDIALYGGMQWLEREHIIGKVRGFLPYVGYVTIAMNDFPQLNASDQTLENQNDEELNSLHGKIKSLRSVTIDILDDSHRQNDQLDRTTNTFSSFTSSLFSTSRHHSRSMASNSTLRQYRTIASIFLALSHSRTPASITSDLSFHYFNFLTLASPRCNTTGYSSQAPTSLPTSSLAQWREPKDSFIPMNSNLPCALALDGSSAGSLEMAPSMFLRSSDSKWSEVEMSGGQPSQSRSKQEVMIKVTVPVVILQSMLRASYMRERSQAESGW
ncbi:Signal peptidase complex catalytic subunit [Saitozyma podzolica]|uniref:Signal peptidase complex catalytic subunit SEC11 n=1 Tax=Saitozyma podzolica TaxID=1890683 RepID=A0A427YM29_9TREE|nr:Signal peptidase complex catalytic subunit [Saitozyma podzolica]